jgi:hypothetical protein
MNPIAGWALAVIAIAIGWTKYGWQGAAFAVTLVVFWLLLQFNRAIRVMKNASSAPVGHVDSAVMFNAKLKRGMTMLQMVALTKALGQKQSEKPERWRWIDASGASVVAELRGGKLESWWLTRPEEPVQAPGDA